VEEGEEARDCLDSLLASLHNALNTLNCSRMLGNML